MARPPVSTPPRAMLPRAQPPWPSFRLRARAGPSPGPRGPDQPSGCRPGRPVQPEPRRVACRTAPEVTRPAAASSRARTRPPGALPAGRTAPGAAPGDRVQHERAQQHVVDQRRRAARASWRTRSPGIAEHGAEHGVQRRPADGGGRGDHDLVQGGRLPPARLTSGSAGSQAARVPDQAEHQRVLADEWLPGGATSRPGRPRSRSACRPAGRRPAPARPPRAAPGPGRPRRARRAG